MKLKTPALLTRRLVDSTYYNWELFSWVLTVVSSLVLLGILAQYIRAYRAQYFWYQRPTERIRQFPYRRKK